MFPEIGKRFLFFTGNLTPDHKAFFSDHKLPYMVKPAPLNLMRQKIMEVMYNFMDQGRPIVESCNHTLA
ncbi:MAG: hypothetical protein C0407_18875 [Desulfobacca sp.]|nr:hypothetical protein [Desulfobacca sp.]